MDGSRQSTERIAWLIAICGFLVVGTFAWVGAGQYLGDVGEAHDWTDQLYLCIQAFTIQLPFDPAGVPYPPALQVARFLGPLVLAWAAIAARATLRPASRQARPNTGPGRGKRPCTASPAVGDINQPLGFR